MLQSYQNHKSIRSIAIQYNGETQEYYGRLEVKYTSASEASKHTKHTKTICDTATLQTRLRNAVAVGLSHSLFLQDLISRFQRRLIVP